MSRVIRQTQDWQHARGHFADGTNVSLDFKAREIDTGNTKPLIRTEAVELWVNVFNSEFEPGDKVRAVLNNIAPSHITQRPEIEDGRIVDLDVREAGQATAKLDPLTIGLAGYAGVVDYHQSLAVVHEGEWKKTSAGTDLPLDLDRVVQW